MIAGWAIAADADFDGDGVLAEHLVEHDAHDDRDQRPLDPEACLETLHDGLLP